MRLLRGRVRTLKLCLEALIQADMPVHLPVMAWLVERAALLVNIRYVVADGCTLHGVEPHPWQELQPVDHWLR